VEDAARYRDALGVPLPVGLPDALLAPAPGALRDLVARYARTHGPFTTADVAARFGLGLATANMALTVLQAEGRLVDGEFRPGGVHREWCDTSVLSTIRRRSLARLRREVEPVEVPALGRLLAQWQGVARPRRGLDALLDVIETLQGLPIPASILERDVLPARIAQYQPSDLDALVSAGEVVWCGVEAMGERDGRIALYLADHLPALWRGHVAPRPADPEMPAREQAILDVLANRGAQFFAALHAEVGGGFPQDTVDALWMLVWHGLVTNDTLQALRALVSPPGRDRRSRTAGRAFRSRRQAPPAAEGRWTLVPVDRRVTPTDWSAATGQQLLTRYGLVTRDAAAAEGLPGGFSALYDVFRTLEEGGRIRRGFFVSGLGAMQFAAPAAVDLLRSLRAPEEDPVTVVLGAPDPANPYGALVKWPGAEHAGTGRGAGAHVVLVDGHLVAWLARSGSSLIVWLPEHEPDRTRHLRELARALRISPLLRGRDGGLIIAEVDGAPIIDHPLAAALDAEGFVAGARGMRAPHA
jgi:ATP-dependent Lhr-like helicase